MLKNYYLIALSAFSSCFFLLGQFSIIFSYDINELKFQSKQLTQHSFLLGCKIGSKLENTNIKSYDKCGLISEQYNKQIEDILK
jgi:hypothetical protein